MVVACQASRSSERPAERSVVMASGFGMLVNGSVSWRGLSRLRVLTAAAVSVVLALGLFAQSVAAATTSITLKPSVGPPTSTVTVNGTGFGASETVVVDFSATQVASATTSSTGTFSATF